MLFQARHFCCLLIWLCQAILVQKTADKYTVKLYCNNTFTVNLYIVIENINTSTVKLYCSNTSIVKFYCSNTSTVKLYCSNTSTVKLYYNGTFTVNLYCNNTFTVKLYCNNSFTVECCIATIPWFLALFCLRHLD